MASSDSIWGLHIHNLKHSLPLVSQCNWKDRSVHRGCKAGKKTLASKRTINKGLWELKGKANEL